MKQIPNQRNVSQNLVMGIPVGDGSDNSDQPKKLLTLRTGVNGCKGLVGNGTGHRLFRRFQYKVKNPTCVLYD
jgi:hypothetical protein